MSNFSNCAPGQNKIGSELGSLELGSGEFPKEEMKSEPNSIEDEQKFRATDGMMYENSESAKPMLRINGVIAKKNLLFEKTYHSNNTTMDHTPVFNPHPPQNASAFKESLKILGDLNNSKSTMTQLNTSNTDRDSQIVLPAIGSNSIINESQERRKEFDPEFEYGGGSARKLFIPKYPSTPLPTHKRQASDTPKITTIISPEFLPMIGQANMNNSLPQQNSDRRIGYTSLSPDVSEYGSDSDSVQSGESLKGFSMASLISPQKTLKKSFFYSFLPDSENLKAKDKRSSLSIPEKNRNFMETFKNILSSQL